jgi:hypothetical protein
MTTLVEFSGGGIAQLAEIYACELGGRKDLVLGVIRAFLDADRVPLLVLKR